MSPGGGNRRAAPHGARHGACAVVALLAGSLGLGGVLVCTPAAAADRLPVTIQLGAVGPSALTPGDDLVVSGRLRNTSEQTIRGTAVRLRLQPGRLTTRDDVQAWSAADALDTAGIPVGTPRELKALRRGQSTAFALRVPATVLGLPAVAEQFGPRGMAVEVTGPAGERLGLSRSSVVWYPGRAFRPTRISLLVPITANLPVRSAAEPSSELDAALAPDGRLDRLLRAAQGSDVAWAVDPALLLAADRTADDARQSGAAAAGQAGIVAAAQAAREQPEPDPSASGSTTSTASQLPAANASVDAAGSWLARFTAGRTGRDVGRLPFADADVAALAHQQGGTLLRRADDFGAAAAREAVGAELDGTLAVPAGGAADAATLAALARAGHTHVVLGAQQQPPKPALGHTASGLSRIRTRADGAVLTGLLYDPVLSAQLTATGTSGGVAATQQLLSELAAVTLERPSDQRSLLAVASRRWNPDPARVQAALKALGSVPWVDVQPLRRLRAAAVPPTPRQAPSYPSSARAAELTRGHVLDVVSADRRLTRFSHALTEPDDVVPALREEALSLLSLAWRGRAVAARARQPFLRDVSALHAGVGVVEGGPYNLLAGAGELPVRVRNRLPYPVRVVVTLRPRTGQLVTDRRVVVTLGPGGGRLVLVPTRSVANGNVDVEATLRSPQDEVLGAPTLLQVRVRRNWESRGVLLLGGLLALLLATGLFRSVRRGRTRVPPGAVPDVDEQALGRARAAAAGPASPPPAPDAGTALDLDGAAGQQPGRHETRTPVPDLGPPGGQPP